MKKLINYSIFASFLFVSLIIYNGCSTQSTETNPHVDADDNPYLITTNGDLGSLSQKEIDAEYNTFFFLPGESRTIHLGGKLPQNYSNYTSVWLENTDIWNPRHAVGLYITDIYSNNYYSVLLSPTDIPYLSGDYPVSAKVGLETNYTSYANRNLTFKVAPYYEARDWGLNVYQQQSYNVLNIIKDEIVKAFQDMKVGLGTNGSEIISVNSNLPNTNVDYDFNPTPVDEDPIVEYVFGQIYPNLNPADAIIQYFTDHPNKGLLFFVSDYTPLNPPPNPPIILGATISGHYGNEVRKQAPISVIYVERNKNLANSTWEDRVIQTTTIHELGHLWCEGFTNSPHTLWHNGNNINKCVMKSGLVYINQEPDVDAQKVLKFRRFCEGHLQRGMNISWHLKQYSPFGETTQMPQDKILLATAKSQDGLYDLDIELVCDKTEIIQGESIDILVKIKNNTNKTLRTGTSKHYLYDSNKDSLFANYSERAIVEISPSSTFYYFVDPVDWLVFSGIDFSTRTLYPGDYKYYLSWFVGQDEFTSNKIRIKVNPVPDSLQRAFNDLKYNPTEYNPNKNYMKEYEVLAEKYKGSFYEQQFYYKLLKTYKGAQGLKANLYKEFVLKYPDTQFSYSIIKSLVSNYIDNKTLIEEILISLKNDKPNCKLLDVLRNQPDYLNQQVKHLLN